MKLRHWFATATAAAVTLTVAAGYYFQRPAWALKTIAKEDAIRLYEGLPHQFYERDLLEREKQAKNTVDLDGYPFYADLLDLRQEDAAALTELVAASGAFTPFRYAKKCGGFHPDYALQWKVGADQYELLICFGCGEAKLFGPWLSKYLEMSSETRSSLEKILRPYRRNRPESKNRGP